MKFGEEMFSENKSQRICPRVALVIVFHLVILLHLLDNVNCQLAWSPIQVDSESEYIDARKYFVRFYCARGCLSISTMEKIEGRIDIVLFPPTLTGFNRFLKIKLSISAKYFENIF